MGGYACQPEVASGFACVSRSPARGNESGQKDFDAEYRPHHEKAFESQDFPKLRPIFPVLAMGSRET